MDFNHNEVNNHIKTWLLDAYIKLSSIMQEEKENEESFQENEFAFGKNSASYINTPFELSKLIDSDYMSSQLIKKLRNYKEDISSGVGVNIAKDDIIFINRKNNDTSIVPVDDLGYPDYLEVLRVMSSFGFEKTTTPGIIISLMVYNSLTRFKNNLIKNADWELIEKADLDIISLLKLKSAPALTSLQIKIDELPVNVPVIFKDGNQIQISKETLLHFTKMSIRNAVNLESSFGNPVLENNKSVFEEISILSIKK